eukprot:4639191-Pyramimonas_sp.AAC.1
MDDSIGGFDDEHVRAGRGQECARQVSPGAGPALIGVGAGWARLAVASIAPVASIVPMAP